MRVVGCLTALVAVILVAPGCAGDDEGRGDMRASDRRAADCADLIEVLPELSGGYPVPRPGGAAAIFDRFDAPDEIRADRAVVANAQARALAALREAGVETGRGSQGYTSEELEQLANVSKAFAQPAVVDAVGRISLWVEKTCPPKG